MTSDFQVVGGNSKAPFTLKAHRGDGMVLLAMNWRNGKPPRNFVGFAIEFKEPKGSQFWPIKNSIGFPGQRSRNTDPPVDCTRAPMQKFRWVHFPRNAELPGKFTYLVTAMFMDGNGVLSRGESQTVRIALMRDTLPGKMNVAFTRGFVSSQAFVRNFQGDGPITTLIPAKSKDGLTFKATHPKSKEAHAWMGFEARSVIHEVLDEAIKKKAEVRVIAYDLNLPEIADRLAKLKTRLKIIIDDSAPEHKKPSSPESAAAARLAKTAGKANVKRQHLAGLQHHKSIAVRGKGIDQVVYGSTNFTWRGFYVQSNNAVVVNSKRAVDDYFDAFDSYFNAKATADFRKTKTPAGWFKLGVPGLEARVGFSPHDKSNELLPEVGKSIDSAKSNVMFSLAFLGQMKRGPIGPALGKKLKNPKVYTLGIADANVKAENVGLTVLSPDNKRRLVRASALTRNVPKPFSLEPSGLSGKGHHRGTRMHHKFVVIDFDRADARVFFGSYNFSEAADLDNGENLVEVRDRTVATSYMIEAVRLFDHYRFRTTHENANPAKSKHKAKAKILTLWRPPTKPSQQAWWARYWDDPVWKREREVFA